MGDAAQVGKPGKWAETVAKAADAAASNPAARRTGLNYNEIKLK